MKMNKKLLLTGLCTIMLSTQIFAQTKTFSINGERTEIEVQVVNDSNYVSLRAISKELGYSVKYDNATKMVTISDGNIVDTIDVLNGAAKIIDGRVYVSVVRVGVPFGDYVEEKVENGSRVIYITRTNSSNQSKNSNTIDSSKMKSIGVSFSTINNENVAALWNSAVYYKVGSNIIETNYMGRRNEVKLSDKVKMVNGVTVFPNDVMDYLYIEPENIEIALDVFGITNYETVKEYWKQGNTNSNKESSTNLTDNAIDNPDNIDDAGWYYSVAKSIMKPWLKDPLSAQFDVTGTPMMFLDDKDIVIRGNVRATNSYGAYITSTYYVIFHDGEWNKFTFYLDGKEVITNQF